MRILIAPDKLRGTYSAGEAAAALGRGWLSARADDSVRQMPLADGGEGTAEALCAAAGGSWRHAAVHDAAGRPLEARFALLDASTAALDVAEACGALRVADLPRDPVEASSAGAGELMRAALATGATTVIVGVGGTATSDGGAGLRAALGPVPPGVRLVAALDVTNPLLGPSGAAAVFGPQKGASPEQVAELERRLAALELPTAERPGAGAGGGIGGMLMAIGAEPASGADLVMDHAGFAAALAGTDLCITAEGRIDMSTLGGKVVVRVAERCAAAAVACIAVGGGVDVAAANELRKLGCDSLEQGDLEHAGYQLGNRHA
jgi:glycerate 2-kinase